MLRESKLTRLLEGSLDQVRPRVLCVHRRRLNSRLMQAKAGACGCINQRLPTDGVPPTGAAAGLPERRGRRRHHPAAQATSARCVRLLYLHERSSARSSWLA